MLPVGVGTPVAEFGMVVTLVAAPSTFGIGAFVVEVQGAHGGWVNNAMIMTYVEMAEMVMGVQKQSAEFQGNGRYEVEVPIGMTGLWQIRVVASRDGEGGASFTFTFPIG